MYLINDAETTTNFNKKEIQYQFLNDFIWDFMEMDLQQIMTLSIIYQQRGITKDTNKELGTKEIK